MADQDLCSDILKWGIWSTSFKYSEREFAEKTIEFFQNNKTYTKQATLDSALKAGIELPIEGLLIPMNLDGSFGASKSQNYSDALVNYFENEIKFKEKYIEKNIQADTGIVQAWTKCQEFRNKENPLLTAEPKYAKIVESDHEDQIIIEITAQIRPENHAKIKIDKARLIKSLESNGCKLLQDKIDPLKDGFNSIIISRSAQNRKSEGTIQIRTNELSYQTDVYLKQDLQNKKPKLIREVGTDKEVKKVVNKTGTNKFTYSISNDKDQDVILRVEPQFDIYGQNETVELHLYAWREEGIGKPLIVERILNWSNWLRQKLYYDVDIPFYKNSPINIEAAFYKWSGQRIDVDTANIRLTIRY